MKKISLIIYTLSIFSFKPDKNDQSWIRINQLGYTTKGIKVSVYCSKKINSIESFELINAITLKTVFTNKAGKTFGSYGPFENTYRLNFTAYKIPGKYFLKAGNAISPVFTIADDVYKGAADFCLQYMRQQRSGFNPFLNDSCHTHDGYIMYGTAAGIKDSTHIDVTGGWHDASDYLQYSTTSANATYHLLMAYRDFPKVFEDRKRSNGLEGKNGIPDVLDEAKWGLDWLLKMHPKADLMFNQLGDDRDHRGMRIPKEDNYYGKKYERPVYVITGEPQQRGKFMNATTGTSSTAAKFSGAFSLGYFLFQQTDTAFAQLLKEKALSAYQIANKKKGVTQTVSVVSPYIYAEENYVDDLELADAAFYNYISKKNSAFIHEAFQYAKEEPITPWLGSDTAKHYQWYPFINLGHYELAKQLTGKKRDTIIQFYKKGISQVWNKAKENAFYRAIPFIWCSNNLTVAFAQQCKWYKELSNDLSFAELEQANIDWLLGCNPWGKSMVYGLPRNGDSPLDPHSAFTHLKNYPINGGLVDGPVYTSIYKNLIGIKLTHDDAYADFQSNLAVYHDDYGDYSTNEPTMDGTASLIYLLAAAENESLVKKNAPLTHVSIETNISFSHGAIVKGNSKLKNIALVFTGDEFGEGLTFISQTLKKKKINASFFFTGRFYRNEQFKQKIKRLINDGHYLGPHSDQHLLYCDWNKRDSLLVSYQQFKDDWKHNLSAMEVAGIKTNNVKYFIPPYEWWNDSVAIWSKWNDVQLFNFTPNTRTNADYTFPEMGSQYKSSEELFLYLKQLTKKDGGLNGSILLMHSGTDPRRKDKLYFKLNEIIGYLKKEGYHFKKIDELLQ